VGVAGSLRRVVGVAVSESRLLEDPCWACE
jgi:hypothetical protein